MPVLSALAERARPPRTPSEITRLRTPRLRLRAARTGQIDHPQWHLNGAPDLPGIARP
jgi:hypothetical protein